MRAVVQRVASASVTVNGAVIGTIGPGLLILVCAMQGDTEAHSTQLAARIVKLRIFRDAADRMNLSVRDTGGAALVVSQFTLHASTKKGNRPSFLASAPPDVSEPLYETFCEALSAELGKPVARGSFGADMQVSLTNDGPVTIWLDSRAKE